ncbi:mitotic checkpoint regulator, MAD2B-interacting-domain-containing protein [Gautieria morchelliformis]|nr:mitotic checkpoint regulator, MAD2B-interacting-domain-containing protein [Gautieria morchelliformis]
MLGLEGYGSDDSDSESLPPPQRPQAQAGPASSTSTKSSFSLPPPTRSLPKPKAKRPVFTAVKPPKATSSDEEGGGGERPAKRPRLDARTAAGSSSLLAMLPAPLKAVPARTAPPRVLGSAFQGGNAGVIVPSSSDSSTVWDDPNGTTEDHIDVVDKSTLLLPPSLAKGKSQAASMDKEPKSVSSTAVDFFSLGSSSSRVTPNTSDSKAGSSSVAVTSAPTIPTFEPPIPAPSDPYPGYYQLPSGQWAAHEPGFYRKHYEMWSTSLALDGATQKGFEGAEGDDTVEVDGQAQLDLARKEREEKKDLTKDAAGGRTAPKMNIKAPKIGSRARTRHQLSALLTEAYENREALEEKIAQGRRNRKEAGNKYGF